MGDAMANDPPTPALRLDLALVVRGLAPSRAAAQRLIEAGLVRSGERVLARAAATIPAGAPLTVTGEAHPWVSRGGVKLAHALDGFAIPVEGRVGLDVGASTGGFTDVLLRRGAARVVAVDVGHGQMAAALREDPRVTCHEHLNARDIDPATTEGPVDLIVCDVSFIGLRVALPAALALAAPGAHLVALIKPQFEVGRANVGKGGIVRDRALHARACATIGDWLAAQPGWRVLGLLDSPIEGGDGNREFLIAAEFGQRAGTVWGE